eukprot:9598988-Lingulodinium_polyedra.AAC.1
MSTTRAQAHRQSSGQERVPPRAVVFVARRRWGGCRASSAYPAATGSGFWRQGCHQGPARAR